MRSAAAPAARRRNTRADVVGLVMILVNYPDDGLGLGKTDGLSALIRITPPALTCFFQELVNLTCV